MKKVAMSAKMRKFLFAVQHELNFIKDEIENTTTSNTEGIQIDNELITGLNEMCKGNKELAEMFMNDIIHRNS